MSEQALSLVLDIAQLIGILGACCGLAVSMVALVSLIAGGEQSRGAGGALILGLALIAIGVGVSALAGLSVRVDGERVRAEGVVQGIAAYHQKW